MRMTYSTRQRLKTSIVFLSIFALIYYFFIWTPGEVDQFQYNTVRKNHAGNTYFWRVFSDFDQSPHIPKQKALTILSEKLQGDWAKGSIDDLVLTRLSGGFTNLVFKCSLKHSKTDPVILRILFQGQADVDNKLEFEIIQKMADKKLGPRLLADFAGGRIEEFVPGHQLTKEEFRSTKLASEIGAKVAEMHGLHSQHKENQLLSFLRRYVDRIITSENTEFLIRPTFKVGEIPKVINVGVIVTEMEKVASYIQRNFNFPTSLVHNDLYETNVMLQSSSTSDKPKLMLIDYEFSLFGHRAADITAYLSDFNEEPLRDVGLNPTEADTAFLEGYLTKTYQIYREQSDLENQKLIGDVEMDMGQLLKEARLYWPIYNFFWALENLVCYIEGNEHLNYEEQYMNRFAIYFSRKSF